MTRTRPFCSTYSVTDFDTSWSFMVDESTHVTKEGAERSAYKGNGQTRSHDILEAGLECAASCRLIISDMLQMAL